MTSYPHVPQPMFGDGDCFAVYFIDMIVDDELEKIARLETWLWVDEGDDGQYWDFHNLEALTNAAIAMQIPRKLILKALIVGRFISHPGIIHVEKPKGIITYEQTV